ncbi:MAG: hypothetical protein JWR53_287 [Glaciihabitans sp.]|nr:hypothetical protein [Glaciihabitans sp.]
MRRGQRVGLSLAAVLVAGLAGGTTAAWTDASWTKAETGTGSFTAGIVNPPRTLTCSQGLFSSPTFSWVAPVAGGLTVSGYRWSLISGTGTVVASGSTTLLTASPSPGGLLTTGTFKFSVVATGPGGWTSVPGPTGTYNITAGLLTNCSVP